MTNIVSVTHARVHSSNLDISKNKKNTLDFYARDKLISENINNTHIQTCEFFITVQDIKHKYCEKGVCFANAFKFV